MSGVDVVAVLDDLVADMGDTPGTTGQQVAQARAAVAELIEAARVIDGRIAYYASIGEDAEQNIEDWAYTDRSGDMARYRAALANVTGGGK